VAYTTLKLPLVRGTITTGVATAKASLDGETWNDALMSPVVLRIDPCAVAKQND